MSTTAQNPADPVGPRHLDAQGDRAATADGAFRALLTPHRSLGPHGFLILMLAIGAVSFGTGIVFLLSGAWPVLVFSGLDVLLIYIAFKLNYRAARLQETVHLTVGELTIRRLHPSGDEQSWQFNPYWVRLIVDKDAQTDRAELKLRSHGRELVFGRFLSDEEKLDFAYALNEALDSARRSMPAPA